MTEPPVAELHIHYFAIYVASTIDYENVFDFFLMEFEIEIPSTDLNVVLRCLCLVN